MTPISTESTDNSPPSRDAENLRTLAIFHYVVAGMTFLVAGLFLVYLVVGASVMHQMSADQRSRLPEGFDTHFSPVGIVGLSIGCGLAVLNVFSARSLWIHKRRRLSLLAAVFNLAWAPVGTVLGVVTIAVLTKETVRRLYDPNRPAAISP